MQNLIGRIPVLNCCLSISMAAVVAAPDAEQNRRWHHPTGDQFRLGDNAIEFRAIKPAAGPTQGIAVELHVIH